MIKSIYVWWLVLLFVFIIPFSQFLSVRILFGVLLLSFLTNEPWRIDHIARRSYDVLFYLLVLSLGLIYSDDLSMGLRVLETNFSFFAISIIFVRMRLTEEQMNRTFIAFISGLVLACLICLGNGVFLYLQKRDIQVFFFYQLTNIIESQPTYFAYYLICAITFSLYQLYYKKNTLNSFLIVAVIAFLFFVLILTGGRTTFISILLVFSFFILKFLVDAKLSSTKLTFAVVITMLASMFIISATERIDRGIVLNDSWERFVLWESAVKAIPDIFLGVGTGDYKAVLNDYYRSHNLSEFANDSYNSHNQFIQILLTNGILGVISVLFLICRPIYLSVKSQDIFGILVFFPFLIYGMTEVFFGRYQGVVFFVLLHQIFISYHYSKGKLPG
jgi:O-antigen ligase